MVMLAKMRGVTSLRSGSTPRARMASICSVTTIDPSSLAMEEALRPETMMPVSTGPSSRIMVRQTNWPVTAVAPKAESVAADCSASTPPVKNPDRTYNGDGSDADNVGLHQEVRPVDGRAKQVHQASPGKDRVVLNGEHDLFGGTVDRVESPLCAPAFSLKSLHRFRGQNSASGVSTGGGQRRFA